MMQWSAASHTHCGNSRRNNQDAVLCSSAQGLWVVADGMGGHEAGEYASESIAQSLSEVTLSANLSDCVDAIEDRLLEVNDHLRRHGQIHCDGNVVGSTVVAFITRGEVGVVLWAGDSRLYRLRGDAIEQITRDHNPISDLLDTGAVSEAEAIEADTHIITRAVGGQRDLHLDVAVFDVCDGDTMLLCSDGLYREISTQDIVTSLRMKVAEAAEQLLANCLSGPARDNVSLVVARAGGERVES